MTKDELAQLALDVGVASVPKAQNLLILTVAELFDLARRIERIAFETAARTCEGQATGTQSAAAIRELIQSSKVEEARDSILSAIQPAYRRPRKK